MSRDQITRRQFIASSAALVGAVFLPSCARFTTSTPLTAVDQVTLGKTGIKLSRLGIGTGTINGGAIQIAMGQDAFNRMVRYAYDQGITYVDTSAGYQTFNWIADAIKGIPREKLFIQCKIEQRREKPMEDIDNARKILNTDYIDSLLVHAVSSTDWNTRSQAMLDAFQEAKQKKIVLAHGASYHGVPALQTSVGLDWVDTTLIRYNPQGVNMDGLPRGSTGDPAVVPPVEEQMRALKAKGKGIISMKIFGEGTFVDAADREKSIRHAMQAGLVDAIVIGFKSPAEIDEAISQINRALADQHAEASYRIAV